MERKAKAATVTGVYLLAIAGILVLVNLLSFRNFLRFDRTSDERFTLSAGSKRLVSEGLKQDLQVDVYVTKGLAKSDIFIQDLTELLKEYENAEVVRDAAPGEDCGEHKDGSKCKFKSRFKFSIIEPKTEDEKAAAKKEGLQEQYLAEGSETGDGTQIKTGFMGLVFKYGAEKEVIPFWPPNEVVGIEFFITNKIREVRDNADNLKTKIGIVTGKDEIKIGDNILAPGNQPFNVKQIFGEYFPFYVFEDVDLQNGDAEINRELAGIVITQPQKDFTEKELRRIDEFLMLGNKAAVFYVSAVNLKPSDATMKATLNLHGIDKLLTGYGIEMKREAVYDFGSGRIPVPLPNQQVAYVMMPPIAVLADDDRFEDDQRLIDPAFPAFFRMRQISLPFPSPLVPHPEKQPEAKLKVVLRSSPRTFVDASDVQDMKYTTEWKQKGAAEQQNLAIAVEGTLATAFPSGDNMGIAAAPKSKSPSRVLVVSSSQFLANPFARSGNPPPMPPQMAMMGNMGGDRELQAIAGGYFQPAFRPMIFSFKNTLDWLANDADLIAVSAKLLGEPTLSYSSVKKPEVVENETEEETKKKYDAYRSERGVVQSNVQWTLVLLPALLFGLFGVLRWQLRESARGRIGLS